MKLTPAEKNAYDALAFLVQAARLPITAKSIKEQLYLHPDFPSLLAMTDILTEWNIPNLATRVSREQLVEIPLPAMAYLEINGGYFAPIQKVTNEQIIWLDTNRGWQTDGLTEFAHKWNGVVLLMEPNENAGEANYKQKKWDAILHNARMPTILIGVLFCLICLAVLFLPRTVMENRMLLGLLMAKLFGIGVTTLLLSHTVDAGNTLLRSLCSMSSRTDCNSVLMSKAAKLWGWLGWAEIGFVYFAGTFLALLMGISTGQLSILSWIVVMNALALPYTVYSIYYQYKIAKSWCLLCLLVQALLWTEFIIGVSYLQNTTLIITGQIIAIFILAFLTPIVFWIILKRPLQEATQTFPLRRELQKVKFNPDYVESLFARQPKMPPVFDKMRVLTIGDPHARHTVTVVTNPLCGPCRRLHPDIEALVERNDLINCQFIFVGSSASTPVTQKLLSLAADDAERAMHLWYSRNNQDVALWNKSTAYTVEYSDADQQGQLHSRWSEMAQITSTPTIYLNGRQLSLAYTLNDVDNLCRILDTAIQPMELANSNKSNV